MEGKIGLSCLSYIHSLNTDVLILCAVIHDAREDTMLRKTEIDSSCSLIKGKGNFILNQIFKKESHKCKTTKVFVLMSSNIFLKSHGSNLDVHQQMNG